MKGDRAMYLQAGMDGYVSKPINRDTMFREIERVMKPLSPVSSGLEPANLGVA
jgi:CheY-like chemotaxis protein